MFVGFFLLVNKKFKGVHPYGLYAGACLSQALVHFNAYNFKITCDMMPKMLLWSTGLIPTILDRIGTSDGFLSWFNFEEWIQVNTSTKMQFRASNVLLYDWSGLKVMFLNINIILNSLVFVDLFLTIRNPFYPRKRRMTTYLFVVLSVVITTFASMAFLYTIELDHNEIIVPLSVVIKTSSKISIFR